MAAILEHTHPASAGLVQAAQAAATLVCVGHPQFTSRGEALYDAHVDPGGLAAKAAAVRCRPEWRRRCLVRPGQRRFVQTLLRQGKSGQLPLGPSAMGQREEGSHGDGGGVANLMLAMCIRDLALEITRRDAAEDEAYWGKEGEEEGRGRA